MTTASTVPGHERLSLSKTLIDTAAAGTIPIAAPVAGTKVRVYRLHLNTHANQRLTLQESAPVVNLLPQQALSARGGLTWDHSGEPWIETASGKGLDLVLADAAQTSGIIWWTQIPEAA